MTQPDDSITQPPRHEPPAPPAPAKRRWRGPSLVWLVPLIALGVGISLLIRSILATGPQITIDFQSADGLRPGRTEVRYKEVVVGRVEGVRISSDRQHVRASIRLDKAGADFAVDDTRFWVVRPRVDTAGISGLETLFSGAYIGMDAGVSATQKREFKGLEAPPFVLRGEPGRSFSLRTDDLGSLDVGSPIYYRRNRVGRVVGYTLDPKVDELSVQIFVEAPYDKLVNTQTRFWNASGVEFSLNASGITVSTQALASLVSGGVAFERPTGTNELPQAADGSRFRLFDNRKNAMAPPDGPALAVRMVFDQTVRGLSLGAPIDFLGIEIGTVKAIRLDYDGKRRRFPIVVEADIFPTRLGAIRAAAQEGTPGDDTQRDLALLKRLVDSGLRAQARTGNLLTGQMYIALDFPTRVAKASVDTSNGLPGIPTIAGPLADIQPQIAEIVAKVNKVPFDSIGKNLDSVLTEARQSIEQLTPEAQKSLVEVQRTLASVQESLAQANRQLFDANSPLQRNAGQTMVDLQRAAQSLRTLADYLQRHPESLIRGKAPDPQLPPPAERR